MAEQNLLETPAEAGFSTNLFLSHPKAGRQQFTFRGATSADWGTVLEDVDRFLHFMWEKGWRFEVKEEAQPISAPVPAAEVPDGMPEGIELSKAEFTSFIVMPQPDSKASVDFYKDGLKWPVAKVVKWKNAAVVDLLAPVNVVDPAKAETYHINGEVFWSQGREYKKDDGTTGHYKDIRAVKPR